MPKFFVASDIHGFYDEFKDALNNAGFDIANNDHWLICCGDYFDRGSKPKEVMDFLMSLPRVILVKGNHEDLFYDLCYRGYSLYHDIANGTDSTLKILAKGYSEHHISNVLKMVRPFSSSMVDYFETKNYIFVHGWIPLNATDDEIFEEKKYIFDPNWRNASDSKWRQARWINGIDAAADGCIEPNKTIVCGHWHCSYGHFKAGETKSQHGDDADFDPYYGNGIIAIDACTAHSGRVNVLVLEDEFIE